MSIGPANRLANRLNIVYDVAYPFVEGGGQKRIHEIARRLVLRGWQVQWHTFKTWEGEDVVERDGITYRGMAGYVPLYGPDGRRSRREATAFGAAVWRHRRLIRDADIVWCGQWPYFQLFPLLLGGHHRLVVDWWETWRQHWFSYAGRMVGAAGWSLERMFGLLVSRLGHLVTISPVGARDLASIGARSQGVSVIDNGIDLARVANAPVVTDAAQLVYAGRLKDHKNVDHIVRALAILRDSHGLQLSADIIGGGPEAKALKDLARSLGVQDQVRFHGMLDDAAMYGRIAAAQVFVHPSTKEGGGSITLFESQACGTPVMIYDAPNGIDTSYVAPGQTGWVVTPVGPAALAEQLARLFGTGAPAKSTTAAACRAAAARYDWQAIADQYHHLFGRLLGRRPQSVPAKTP